MDTPLTLTIQPMAAMLNFEIADDPHYTGLEVQRFDDATHGAGFAVLLVRRSDRKVDVHRSPGLRLDPAGYGIHAGLGEWRETEIAPAVLEVTSTGTVCDIGLRDAAGRHVEVRVDDRDGRVRRTGGLLAPVGAAIDRPTSMLLVWMPRFDLLRASGRAPEIVIDGRRATTGRLPMAWLHHRRLIKAAADLVVVQLCPAVKEAQVDTAHVARVSSRCEGHEAALILDPALPDLTSLEDGAGVTGTWRLALDGQPSLVSGSWSARRDGPRVDLVLDSMAPWRPGRLPLLMRIVTRVVPTFRQWPRTYRWHGTVTLGPPATLTSRWERTAAARDESYARLMRVPSR